MAAPRAAFRVSQSAAVFSLSKQRDLSRLSQAVTSLSSFSSGSQALGCESAVTSYIPYEKQSPSPAPSHDQEHPRNTLFKLPAPLTHVSLPPRRLLHDAVAESSLFSQRSTPLTSATISCSPQYVSSLGSVAPFGTLDTFIGRDGDTSFSGYFGDNVPSKQRGISIKGISSKGNETPEVRQLVITACGPDRPGLVSKLTKRILECGGNVEQSRMSRLAGEFSIIMLSTVDASIPSIAEDLHRSLQTIDGLQITTRWSQPEKVAEQRSRRKFRRILLKGADNPGLVYNVTEYLAGNKINIENLETGTEEAPFGGVTLFTMEGVIAMPVNMPTKSLCRSLEVLQDSLGVLIELQNLDPQKKAEDLDRFKEQSVRVGGASRYSILEQGGGRAGKGDMLI